MVSRIHCLYYVIKATLINRALEFKIINGRPRECHNKQVAQRATIAHLIASMTVIKIVLDSSQVIKRYFLDVQDQLTPQSRSDLVKF